MQHIWLDTDIGPDCDDTAALAILHWIGAQGASQTVCITHCTSSPYGLPTISAINQCFGVKVPLGTSKQLGFLTDAPLLAYTREIAARYPHDYPETQWQPDVISTVTEALRAQEDHSVTLIAIGPLNNIAVCLKEPTVCELMKNKLRQCYLMGGCFIHEPIFAEWNIEMDIPSAQYVSTHMPCPITYCPFEAGETILTGECLRRYPTHPVALSYQIKVGESMLRPSWDLVTVYAALWDANHMLAYSPWGTVNIDAKGYTVYMPRQNGNARFLLKPKQCLQARLETLLDEACQMTAEKNIGR